MALTVEKSEKLERVDDLVVGVGVVLWTNFSGFSVEIFGGRFVGRNISTTSFVIRFTIFLSAPRCSLTLWVSSVK